MAAESDPRVAAVQPVRPVRPVRPAADGSDEAAPKGREARLLGALERLLGIEAVALEPALQAAAQLVSEVFRADKGDVFLLEEESATLVALGTSMTPMGIKQHQLGLHRLPLANRDRVAETFETGVTYWSGRVHEDEAVPVGVREALGVRSMVACAFADPGGATETTSRTASPAVGPPSGPPARRGVLLLSSVHTDYFTQRDVPFMEMVARWIGMVVHRARLVDRLRAHAAAEAGRLAAEELVAVLAHDLRNYLTPMKMRLQMLRRTAVGEGQQRWAKGADGILSDVARLDSLVTDLLDVSRLERGTFAVTPQPTDLGALARETAAAMSSETVVVRVWPWDGGPVEVRADPARVRQALENLVANAVQHSPPGASVEVCVAREEGSARWEGAGWGVVSVRDEGPGIPVEQLPALFTRFGAGAGSVGLGLGLYIARRIAEAHGGSVTVDTAPGKGATFSLRLPALPAPPAPPAPPALLVQPAPPEP